ncbi:MAG: aminodeoxychorismate synthase, component I [Hyphococcus sp.]|nr:MAG: aminodeoxychorismate synthase, component I [Marinicaulis sp.]
MFCWEIDWRAPYTAFAPLAGKPHAHLLHGGDHARSQWSIIAAFPSHVFTCGDDGDRWLKDVQDAIDGRTQNNLTGESNCDAWPLPKAAPFTSGLIGYVGYEALQSTEPSLDLPQSPHALPNGVFGVYDCAAVFSREDRRAFIVGRDEAAGRQLRDALGRERPSAPSLPKFSAPNANFTQSEYENAVRDVIARIEDGDFYQVNIAQRLSVTTDDPYQPYDLFRIMAARSDAPFAACLHYADGVIVSNSPERFFRVSNGANGIRRIVTEPIKGTRPRGKNVTEDEALQRDLLADPKDRAENIMIADLLRNDLSKVCKDGSIKEDAVCELLSISSVHHLVSRISGALRDGVTVTDIFRALFPCGSITGAPKIAAMEVIADVEQSGRGPYCGAIGYINDNGDADFSVAIRTLIADRQLQSVSIPVGGGITLRSNPKAEYQETLTKAQSALDALL